MNETHALAKMKAPGDERRNVWRGGILQIHVTRACDLGCFGCTQGSNLAGRPVVMTPDEFEIACGSLKEYWGVVGMFGGNPAVHPQFETLCEIFARHFPFEQRGIWCNHPRGKGAIMRRTFNPNVSNLNVHLSQEAHDEFVRDWPECAHKLKGLREDSRHAPWAEAMVDLKTLKFPDGTVRENTAANRWELISACDVNQRWSAMLCAVPGRGVQGFFCEIAGAMAMLHAHDPKWPDLGVPAVPGWWRAPMQSPEFTAQARYYCHRCGMPQRSQGQLAIGGEHETVSETHADVYRPKDRNRPVHVVDIDLAPRVSKATAYLKGEKV